MLRNELEPIEDKEQCSEIEVFLCTKSLLRLQKEFQGRSNDLLISHTTIVFSRYILLSLVVRIVQDSHTDTLACSRLLSAPQA